MLKSWICALWLALAPMACLMPDAASAEEESDTALNAADTRAVRAIVEAQLKAFAEGNAKLAYSYAAPAIQTQFGDAQTFATMVQQTYPMLIRPTSTSFFRPEWHEGLALQVVQFRGSEGTLWRAVYQLQRQPDLSWRISGCVVAAANEASTT